jgi:hypothetical protein
MPRPRATRASSTAARRREPKRCWQSENCSAIGEQAADHDDEQAIAADADAEQVDLALQVGRDRDELLLRAHHVVDRRDRHEHEADREQHLLEMGLGVDVNVERALERDADQRGEQERERQRARNGRPSRLTVMTVM